MNNTFATDVFKKKPREKASFPSSLSINLSQSTRINILEIKKNILQSK